MDNYYTFSYIGCDQICHTEEFTSTRECLSNVINFYEEHGCSNVCVTDQDSNIVYFDGAYVTN